MAWQTALILLLPVILSSAHAKGIFDDDSEETSKPLVETPVVLPAFPLPDNMLPFSAGPIATQSFAIDSKSLTVSPEEIRYVLVTTSSSGAQNISYEGIRCETFEMRRYAFGHKDGKWSLSSSSKWQPISFLSSNRPQAALAQDYFCMGGSVAGKPDEMLDRIRYNRSLMEKLYKSS